MKKQKLSTWMCLFLAAVMTGSMLPVKAAGPQCRGVIIYHNDCSAAAQALRSELLSRNYNVHITGNANTGLQAITQAAAALQSGDRLMVYLAGHGSNPRYWGDTSQTVALEHYVGFVSGALKVGQFAPLFEGMANRGVHVTVIDGSCCAGETVLYATGQKYCALSTTGVYSPGLTKFPYPSNSIARDSNPGRFGSWWNYPHLTASWMNGEIIRGVPLRINQRLFRNDNTAIAKLSLFLRPTIGHLTMLDQNGWNLHYQYCYLYRFIYPDEYAAMDQTEKSKFVNGLQTYLNTMHAIYDPGAKFITQLNGVINNTTLVNQAASAYASNYTRIWRTLANDPEWNVAAEPRKYAELMRNITPDNYQGASGFRSIAQGIEYWLGFLKSGFRQQESLLGEIDALVRELYPKRQLPDSTLKIINPVWSFEPEMMEKYQRHEKIMNDKIIEIEKGLELDSLEIVRPVKVTDGSRRKLTLDQSAAQIAEKYQGAFQVSLDDRKIGISQAVLDAIKRKRLEEKIGRFKAYSPAIYNAEARLNFLLSIFEDAVNKVSGGGTGVALF